MTSKINILLSAYACRPNAGSELGIGWNWAVHLAETGSTVHVLTAGRNREATEAYQREHPSSELHFHFIDVPWMRPNGIRIPALSGLAMDGASQSEDSFKIRRL